MTDLGELFARDPLKLTREYDIPIIVKRMREAQAQFELGIKMPVAERPKKKKVAEDFSADIEALLGGVDPKKLGIG